MFATNSVNRASGENVSASCPPRFVDQCVNVIDPDVSRVFIPMPHCGGKSFNIGDFDLKLQVLANAKPPAGRAVASSIKMHGLSSKMVLPSCSAGQLTSADTKIFIADDAAAPVEYRSSFGETRMRDPYMAPSPSLLKQSNAIVTPPCTTARTVSGWQSLAYGPCGGSAARA